MISAGMLDRLRCASMNPVVKAAERRTAINRLRSAEREITMGEAMDVLAMSRTRLHKLIKRGKIMAYKIQGRWQVDTSSIEEYIRKENDEVSGS